MTLDDDVLESVKLANVSVSDENKSHDLQPTEDELLIVFEKIVQQKVRRKSLTNKESNIVCRFFESGFCRKKNRCQYLHVSGHFKSGCCKNSTCSFDHLNLCADLSCVDSACNLAHASRPLIPLEYLNQSKTEKLTWPWARLRPPRSHATIKCPWA